MDVIITVSSYKWDGAPTVLVTAVNSQVGPAPRSAWTKRPLGVAFPFATPSPEPPRSSSSPPQRHCRRPGVHHRRSSVSACPAQKGSVSSAQPGVYFTDMDYAPATTEDVTFSGVAVGSGIRCRVHKLEPVRCVAFEGMNTGRRFYMCPIRNEVENCGFVSWYDENEWPQTLGTALFKLWRMYEESQSARIEERIESAKLLQEIVKQKEKAEKDYASLMQEVDKVFSDSSKQVMKANYIKLTTEKAEFDKLEDELFNANRDKKDLMAELEKLKQVEKSQADMLKSKQQAWDLEREKMKEEKKKIEYMLYDLVKARDEDKAANVAEKEKINRIKAICEE